MRGMIAFIILAIFAVIGGTVFGFGAMLFGGVKRASEERAFQKRFGMSQAQFQHDYAISHGISEGQWAQMNVYQRNNWIKAQVAAQNR